MWGLGTSANTAVLGHMGSSAVAANSVAQVARQLATVVSLGYPAPQRSILERRSVRENSIMQEPMPNGLSF